VSELATAGAGAGAGSGRTLILLRHGRTEWNRIKRVQGQLDVDLDDVGRAQAQAVAPVIAALSPSVLWTSDLRRASDTAAAVAAACALDAVPDKRLREFAVGEREGLTHEEFEAAAPEEFARFREGHLDAARGAESGEEVATRVAAALTDLLGTLDAGQTGVAVSHGGAIRIGLARLLGWPDDLFHSLRGLENCGWAVLCEDGFGGRLRLLAYNRTAT